MFRTLFGTRLSRDGHTRHYRNRCFHLLVHQEDAEREFFYDHHAGLARLTRGLDKGPGRGWTIAQIGSPCGNLVGFRRLADTAMPFCYAAFFRGTAMLKRRDIIASGMLLPAAAAAALPQSKADNPLVGAWSLTEATTVNAQESRRPWLGRKMLKGVIIYDVSGTVSVQISSARNAVSARTDFLSLPDDQRLAYLDSYYAYYGRYQYDAQSSTVTHFVEASLYPDEVGMALKRFVFLNEDEVTLTTPASPNGSRNVLQWRRIA